MSEPTSLVLLVVLTFLAGRGEVLTARIWRRLVLAWPTSFAARWQEPSSAAGGVHQKPPFLPPPLPLPPSSSSPMANEREIVLLTRLLGLTTRSLERALRRVRTLRREQSTHRWPIYIAVVHLVFLGPFWVYLVLDGQSFAVPWIVLLALALASIGASYAKTKMHLADSEREAESLVTEAKSIAAMLWPTWSMQRLAEMGLKDELARLEQRMNEAAFLLGPSIFDAVNLAEGQSYRHPAPPPVERVQVLS